MRILKSHPLLKMVNSYVVDSPTPSNISYLWNFGSLLAFCLVIQIVTGVTLGMHYTPNVLEAFDSVEHIMRDVNNGWLIRYLHSNTASAFFFLVYLHIGRGLYYGSYKAPRTLVWTIGTILFILMMATAFLGYIYSPIWFKLNSYNFILNIFSFVQNDNIIIIICSFIFIISFIVFYLDNLKLSNNSFVKLVQVFSFICILLILIIFVYNLINNIDILSYVSDKDNIGLQGSYNITKESAENIGKGMNSIGQGLSTVGSQLGLGATMVGISTAVGKGVAKSGMPPLQKTGFIVGSGLVAGLGHSWISSINRNAITAKNTTTVTTSISNIDGSHVNKFVNNSHISPLQEFLFNGEMMNYVCLGLIYLLIIQLVFKLYFKNTISLKFFKLLGNNLNNKIEFYVNKIIKLNKQMSIIWIWFGLVTIIFGLSIEAYALHNICFNIDSFIDVHISYNPNLINNNIHVSDKSIKDILLNLKVINYISIFIMISLILEIILKFHLNKDINNIYIWLVLLVLILALAFTAHTYGDLYTHIDNYVNMYINLKNK